MTAPQTWRVTEHAVAQAMQRWHVSPSEAAEAAIHEVLRDGQLQFRSEDQFEIRLAVTPDSMRVVRCVGGVVVTAVMSRSRGAENRRRKAQRKRKKRAEQAPAVQP
ncbi:hypothetical protein [Deinococcus sp. QL22]|uniref:hypothetical protein n=1 Tax=Deinococcus sp. QL22 TaxID=2939437 RepID=UPI0020180DE8|nr:hypothetical protein [Deinococcus sp. QL22]UQN10305.1 hypothetical protein M1R55_29580 [Deinococcus sp. QL22]UQN10439.1 hypothetical protein M1R55_28905 [Deinococcus sp. QL22]